MEAFAICGIDHTTTCDDAEEHTNVIVDVAVIAADALVEPPWERCAGATNCGIGLRRVGIAVRKAPRADAPAYVVDARISASRPGVERGWTVCAQLDGTNPSLSAGLLTVSARAPLLLWRRVAAPSNRVAPLVALRFATDALARPWVSLATVPTTQFPRTAAFVLSRRGQTQLWGARAAPMRATPKVLASWGQTPQRFADLVFDDDVALTRKPRDALSFEEFSFTLTDATGASTSVACVRFDSPRHDQGAELLCEPVAFCLLFRRADARAAMRTAVLELYRLALSKQPRAFRVLLATLARVPLPAPHERVDVRVCFVDATPERTPTPLREIEVRSNRVVRAGLRSVDDANAWRAFLARLPGGARVRYLGARRRAGFARAAVTRLRVDDAELVPGLPEGRALSFALGFAVCGSGPARHWP